MEFTSYEQLKQYIKEHDYELVLDYGDDFEVYKIEGRYWYWNDEELCEVQVVAELKYDVLHDINAEGSELSELFESCCCGEYVYDSGISYLWFEGIV
jgi:hypothetical protein